MRFNMPFHLLAGFALLFLAGSAGAEHLLAVDRDGGRVHVVGLDDFRLRHSVAVGAFPHEVIGLPGGARALVALYGDGPNPGHELVEIDLVAGTVARRTDIRPFQRPHGLARAGDNVYVTAEANRAVIRYNPAEGRLDRAFGLGGDLSHMLVVVPDRQQIFTSDLLSGSVSQLDFRPGGPLPALRRFPVGDKPEGIAVRPDGKELWVGLNGEGRIAVLDAASGAVLAHVPAGSYPARVQFSRDGATAYSIDPEAGVLLVFDVASRTLRHRHVVDGLPLGIAPAAQAGRVYLTLPKAGAVVELDVESGKALRRAELGQVADGIALVEEEPA